MFSVDTRCVYEMERLYVGMCMLGRGSCSVVLCENRHFGNKTKSTELPHSRKAWLWVSKLVHGVKFAV